MPDDAVIFDLDGTLVDTSLGIMYCFDAVADTLRIPRLSASRQRAMIGGPLLTNIREAYQLNESQAKYGVEVYRAAYAQTGVHMATTYKGIAELLTWLKAKGIRTAVATLKRVDFAQQMLGNLGIGDLFDIIMGADRNDTLTKADLLIRSMEYLGVTSSHCTLVGDSIYDAQGAKKVGMRFIAVTGDFGFTDFGVSKLDPPPIAVANSLPELSSVLRSVLFP